MRKRVRAEVWRSVPGEPYVASRYQVSNYGRIKTLAYVDRRGWRRKEQLLTPQDAEIHLTDDRDVSSRSFALAELILRAFVGPRPEGMRVTRHLDDDRTNNIPENLAWGTDADNIADAMRNGQTFISRGNLGNKHSAETKEKLSKIFKGRPTGRKITKEHRRALEEGYRKRFPEKSKPKRTPCACGCGELASPGKQYVHGHSGRIRFRKIAKSRIGKPRSW